MNVTMRKKSKVNKEAEVKSSASVLGTGEVVEVEEIKEPINEESQEVDELIDSIVSSLKKKFGEDAVFCGEDNKLCSATDWVSLTPEVDKAIGTPGVPAGHIAMIYGKKDSGKTTLACHALQDTQKKGGVAVLCLTERKFSDKRAKDVGVNVEKVIKLRCKTLEDAFAKMEETVKAIRSQNTDRMVTIVWDSLAGTVSKAELAGEADSQHMAVAAKVINMNFRRLSQFIADEKICLIIINRVYEKIGVMFGKKTRQYGGLAVEYVPSLHISINQIGKLYKKNKDKETKEIYGIKSKIEIEKNHLAKPFGECEIEIDENGIRY